MKAATFKVAFAVVVCLSFTVARAQAVAASITESRHNFQLTTNTVRVANSAEEDGLCVFCHTPHKGKSSLLLWNREFGAVTEYTWADVGGGKTTNGTDYPKNLLTWDGSSRKCLGCHDGTVSVGQILWSNAGGPRSITMTGADQTAGKISNSTYVIAPGGLMNGNHPVGVPYPYGGATVTTYNGITSSIDSAAKLAKWNPTPDAGGAAVKIFGAGGGGAPVAGAAGIECASCHDPHAGTGNPFYLRVSKNGSQLCLTCHKK